MVSPPPPLPLRVAVYSALFSGSFFSVLPSFQPFYFSGGIYGLGKRSFLVGDSNFPGIGRSYGCALFCSFRSFLSPVRDNDPFCLSLERNLFQDLGVALLSVCGLPICGVFRRGSGFGICTGNLYAASGDIAREVLEYSRQYFPFPALVLGRVAPGCGIKR